MMHPDTDFAGFVAACSRTDSIAELLSLAMAELGKFPDGAEMVCGPMTTGGRGSVEANIAVFTAVVAALRRLRRPLFSQLPYEERTFFFCERWRAARPDAPGIYFMPILEEFYLPLIQSGRIRAGWFIPGWQSSFGARWERAQLEAAGAQLFDLTSSWVDSIV